MCGVGQSPPPRRRLPRLPPWRSRLQTGWRSSSSFSASRASAPTPRTQRTFVRAGEWVRDFIRAAGGEAELQETTNHPLVIGEIRASGERRHRSHRHRLRALRRPAARAPLEGWETPPFEPDVRDGWLYARGVADDKGQLYLLLKAAALLAAEGSLPGERPVHLRRRGGVRRPLDRRLPRGGRAWGRRLRDLRRAHAQARRPGVRDRNAGHRLLPRAGANRRARPPLRHLRRGSAERDARADAGARRRPAPRRAPARAAARRHRQAERRRDRELERARHGRRGPRRPGRPAGRRARGRGALPANLGRACGRRARPRRRLAAPAEDRAAGRRRGERLHPARAAVRTTRRSQPRWSASCARRRRTARTSRSSSWRAPRRRSCRPDDPAIRLGQEAFERVDRRAAAAAPRRRLACR